MEVDNPNQTFGVAASMHAPPTSTGNPLSVVADPPTNHLNPHKRNRATAELDNSDDDEISNDLESISNADDPTQETSMIITAPPHDRRFLIDGAHPREVFALLTPGGRRMWVEAPNNDHAVCAFIPGDRFPEDGDPTATVRAIRNIASFITKNSDIDVLPATPDNPADGQNALYVICYIINLTENDKTTLLKHPLFCTPEGNMATFELDLIPNSHVGVWGKSCLTDDPNHVLTLRETIKDLITKPGSGPFRALHNYNDRIPLAHNKSPSARASYIASTVEISPITLKRRERDGTLTDHTCFNVYIESPTYDLRRFNQWLDLLGKHTFRTRWGTVSPVEPFFCTHCGSRAHPSGLCAYPSDVVGFQVRSAPNAIQLKPESTTTRSGFRGRGRARGNIHRGRGSGRGRTL